MIPSALFIARDGVVVGHSTLPLPPTVGRKRTKTEWTVPALMREACAYYKTYPRLNKVLDVPIETWSRTCEQWPHLVAAHVNWSEVEYKRDQRSISFLNWLDDTSAVARKQKLHAYVGRTLMERVNFLPGVIRTLNDVALAGWPVYLLTVQSQAAEAGYTVNELVAVHRVIMDWIHVGGGRIAGSRIWPHEPVPEDLPATPYRDMIQDVAGEAEIGLARAWFVVASAPAAEAVTGFQGMRAIVTRGDGSTQATKGAAQGEIVADLEAAIRRVEEST